MGNICSLHETEKFGGLIQKPLPEATLHRRVEAEEIEINK
jgi:hypothetical protein